MMRRRNVDEIRMMRALGGRPRFLLGASSPAASAVEVPDFLFLEPLGRPLPRLAGVSAAPADGFDPGRDGGQDERTIRAG